MRGCRLSVMEAFGRCFSFTLPALSRCSHLKLGAFFFYDLVSSSLSSVSGCCMWNADHWILHEMTWSMGATLGSTMVTCSASVLGFWTNFTQIPRCRGLEF